MAEGVGSLLGWHKPAPNYDHFRKRRFEFIRFRRFLVFFPGVDGASTTTVTLHLVRKAA
jgi:hypothetical protein